MMPVSRECEGKVALVTGASRGIGAAIAQRLASAGAAVAAVARSVDTHPPDLPGTLRETVATIEAQGGRAVAIQGDVLDTGSRVQFVTRCQERLGSVDILVNNAAVGPYKSFDSITTHDVQITYEANVRAPFELCQLVLAGMREKKRGWMLNISSATAEHPHGPPFIPWEQMGGHMLYGSSKAALNRFTTGLAAELYRDGIAVNALSPVAAVITPGVEAMGISHWIEPSMIEPIEAMAEAALVLCSCDPATMTGRVAYSLKLLEELGRPIRTLDGGALYTGATSRQDRG
jgi:NAD(P)-dependent dehydrogenase (short-subunit alcohol dehydrogenase family)